MENSIGTQSCTHGVGLFQKSYELMMSNSSSEPFKGGEDFILDPSLNKSKFRVKPSLAQSPFSLVGSDSDSGQWVIFRFLETDVVEHVHFHSHRKGNQLRDKGREQGWQCPRIHMVHFFLSGNEEIFDLVENRRFV
ncbi:hypothetical protein V6N12_041919 [Hibiscus sabdariffa]|uniref:Uncharacterized protein n=1 Tax=Hibiscus sabdariffa TaxID=183260 RepID=A0ABR2ED96_9ROSI